MVQYLCSFKKDKKNTDYQIEVPHIYKAQELGMLNTHNWRSIVSQDSYYQAAISPMSDLSLY